MLLRPSLLRPSLLRSSLGCQLVQIGWICCLLGGLPAAKPALAEVVRDRTLPVPTRVTSQGETLEITGGTQAGSNLFHSFERFSVPTGRAAFFNNAASVRNIFGRVTGRLRSRIDGELRANSSANLFLLNPNGILFGPNASLNLGGSFVGSSANSLRFADGREFSAVSPQAAPLLTVSQPVGLQFGASPSPFGPNRPGQIQVQGSGHALFLNSPTEPSVNRSNRPAGLEVNPGQTLALMGSDLALLGGNLTAASGQIELGSVAAGQVKLTERLNGRGWRFDYADVPAFRDIHLRQAASLEASGNQGGEIRLQGRVIQITGASALLADTLGSGSGGLLQLRASERLRVAGFAPSSAAPFVSRLSTDVAAGATGAGGLLTIATPKLQITSGGQISSGTFGAGDAGTLRVETTDLLISGSSAVGPSGLFVPVEVAASGNGGTLVIQTGRLRILDQAQIAATTFGLGDAGRLSIQADQVELQRSSGIFAGVEPGAVGNGKTLTLRADQIQIAQGAQIATLTAGAGNAGNIAVNAREIELVGSTGQFASGLSASVEPGSAGRGGSITVTAQRLQIRDGAEISTTTFSNGRAGNLAIRAEEIELIGGSSEGPSALLAAARGNGDGGNLTLNADRLRITAGGQIATATSGSGRAGDLTITTSELVELSGGNAFARSGLFASAIDDIGTGGNLQIATRQLVVRDGATISVSNFPSRSSGLQPGQGGVGNLSITADLIRLADQAVLTADSAAGDQGNIALQSDLVLLNQQSAITTNAIGNARGGNITIESDILAAANNSDITANAEDNFGGQITISADAVLGTQVRPRLTSRSDITASSALGTQFSGTVQLNAPEINPSQEFVQLSDRFINASSQIVAVCTETADNQFVVTGRGGLPEAPIQLLRGGTIWEDLRTPAVDHVTSSMTSRMTNRESNLEREAEPEINRSEPELVEAAGWQIDQSGQVILVSQANAQPQIQAQIRTDCSEAEQNESGS
ncbi:MAG: S-layer family protein [Pegethrix bostrychoides GSE-TBD4-15B]|uniref:S-layer family protein n=1 Tax=Pegethrix bostrychoides GSE-TBD4-15B TaxID=2839662 RepID=A0A951PFD6_9CYAN|nr:S-layer family protein [Pegethrix bostrychoides GSE-TBD4-15B]